MKLACIVALLVFVTIAEVSGSLDDCYRELRRERNWAERESDGELVNIYVCADEMQYLKCADRELALLPDSAYKRRVANQVEENRGVLRERCGHLINM